MTKARCERCRFWDNPKTAEMGLCLSVTPTSKKALVHADNSGDYGFFTVGTFGCTQFQLPEPRK